MKRLWNKPFGKVKWMPFSKDKSMLLKARWGKQNWSSACCSKEFNLGSLTSFLWMFTLEGGEGFSKKFNSLEPTGQYSKLQERSSSPHDYYGLILICCLNSKTPSTPDLRGDKCFLTVGRAWRISSQNERFLFFSETDFLWKSHHSFCSYFCPLLKKKMYFGQLLAKLR